MTKRFTGWHATTILVAMFGVIITVNLIMARFAVTTFSGTVVDNSYVASQHFNRWLAAAEAQKALGWTLDVALDDTRRVKIGTHSPDGPLPAATIRAIVAHPIGRAEERMLGFVPIGEGRFRSAEPLPAGRWKLRITVQQGDNRAIFDDEVPA
ncbi:FixH family protein [Sphingomonas sp.]|uniref:FixH family protein n=1 Tax=Sphingomonas sp. TaxID=28214 RepID=UPI002DD6AD86|nr:FixH family protein [Sphingomonas sp.]